MLSRPRKKLVDKSTIGLRKIKLERKSISVSFPVKECHNISMQYFAKEKNKTKLFDIVVPLAQ